MEINLLLSYSSIHKKSYFVQKIVLGAEKVKYQKECVDIKNKMDDTYKKFNDGRFRLCQELRTTVYTLDNIPLRRTMIRMLLQREDKIAENCNG